MSEAEKEIWVEGVVRAKSYGRGAEGKQFLGAVLEGVDGKAWVIDYSELSPFHAFADCRVLVCGEPYRPKGQYLMGWRGRTYEEKNFGHFRVSAMRLGEVTAETHLMEVGVRQELVGRFERGESDRPESRLFFVTERGDRFLVFNDPPGASVGGSVEVSAYRVKPSAGRAAEAYLWVIPPSSWDELLAWRERHA